MCWNTLHLNSYSSSSLCFYLLVFLVSDLEGNLQEVVTDLEWTATKNDLIELVYALQQIKAISYRKVSINKIITIFDKIFNIDLKDSHHAFHRMKTRAKSRTVFLDELKKDIGRIYR